MSIYLNTRNDIKKQFNQIQPKNQNIICKKYEIDKYRPPNNASSPSFKAIEPGYELILTPEEEKALAYKIKLTPEKIDSIIWSAKSPDTGLVDAYKELYKEATMFNNGLINFISASNKFKIVTNNKINKLKDLNIPGSGTPVLGIIVQGLGYGRFMSIIKNASLGLFQDIDNFKNIYYEDIYSIKKDYTKASDHLVDTLSIGSKPVQIKVLEKIQETNTKLLANSEKIQSEFDNTFFTFNEQICEIYKEQSNRQMKRLGRKVLTAGLK